MSWPKLYFMDISRYYLNVVSKQDLWQRLESEYKEGKAYRCVTNGFIEEILINDQEILKYCMFKTKCFYSHKVNNKQYDVWCVVEKDDGGVPGGIILAEYCTCTAGLLGE